MTECIFCKIADGTIPSAKVYEDDNVLAFMDIMPTTKGHVLLIPKVHRENIYEFSEEEAANLFSVAPKIANALKAEFEPAGMNLLNNTGSAASQSVYHFHLHFIPRYDRQTDGFGLKWETKEQDYPPERLQEIAGDIAARLGK
ncbi:HIT family protein [Edaphobacillus lindanitolerans]|uniref:Histidine triad (HIT) family protein n=1 Tax=Edaphobacillus lindanitolerans TaxID=550447 RepID=A0A1U7PS97_9BACI|nr:HIT family protein [Edaphobacillus lindanitolerans]SIT90930.1 histidine triad (HIT) family protein [Edaphobacillus lindanitolerans]